MYNLFVEELNVEGKHTFSEQGHYRVSSYFNHKVVTNLAHAYVLQSVSYNDDTRQSPVLFILTPPNEKHLGEKRGDDKLKA